MKSTCPLLLPVVNLPTAQQVNETNGRPVTPYTVYEPRIYGFRIHEQAPNGPCMQWLRWREKLMSEHTVRHFRRRLLREGRDASETEEEMAEDAR